MADQKHFTYDGNAILRGSQANKDAEILDVAFLTPARIKIKVGDKIRELNVGVDIINRKVYEDQGESQFSDLVFDYLDTVNSLPDNFFEASDEIYQQAASAKDEHDQMNSVKEGLSDV